MGVHQGGQRAGLAAQHITDGGLLGRPVKAAAQEPIGRHPRVVEDFRHVAPAAVGQQDDDQRVGPGFLGDLERGNHRHPARPADQHRLFAGQPPGHVERVGVGHRDDLVGHARVIGRRPEILADPLDQIRSAGTARIDRSLRVGADDAYSAPGHLFEVPASAGDGTAGADASHEMGDLALGIGPDFRAGGHIMACRSLRVGVLVGLPGTVDITDQPVRHTVVAGRIVRRDRRRAHHDLGAVGDQHIAFILTDLVRADEHALVAAALSDQRQTNAGIAGRGFDDGATRLQLTAGLGGFDHLHRDPILGAAARVEILDLCGHGSGAVGYHGVQPNQWGTTNEFTDMLRDPHAFIVSGACRPGTRAPSASRYPVASRMYSPI
ncbi:Uncharacterised protein [Mycobacterium tuberculosis]|nr:Uncharacterised protein [Mycobacterium tuberculosis]CKR02194.1 Uncharacterised protein [Mycobacterium tuberculosis]CKT03380.1 Uncharacterised protein [Mycobacterium tuberculosis]CKT04236.1 Uncharacterised protein [Mycobacterium tuberculosis]